MALIALIVALLINAHLPAGGWRSARGFYRYAAWLQGHLLPRGMWNHGGGLALLILPLLLPVALIQWGVGDDGFGLIWLVLSVAALCFVFGGGETIEAEVAAFAAAWRRGDESAAASALNDLAGGPAGEVAFERMPEAAAGHLILRARTRIFAPIFWFVLLGPMGALGYRLVVLARAFGDCQENAGPDYCGVASRVLGWLDWMPDRLCALALALAGHFNAAWSVWEEEVGADASRRLAETGLGALGLPLAEAPRDLTAEAVMDTHAMVRRALYVWLAAVALGVLFAVT